MKLVKPLLGICSKEISCKRKTKNLYTKNDSNSVIYNKLKLDTAEMFLHTGMDKVQYNNF